MGRVALAMVVGYVAMVVWIQATYFLAQGVLGDDPPSSWTIVNIVLSFVGGYIGGSLTMRLGRERAQSAVRGVALFVVIVGLGAAVRPLVGGAFEQGQTSWYSFIIPFIGAAGVMLGGRRRPSQ